MNRPLILPWWVPWAIALFWVIMMGAGCAPVLIASWPETITRVARSVVPLGDGKDTYCSAVVVAGDRLLTEEHCLDGTPFWVDGIPARLVVTENELALIQAARRHPDWRDIAIRRTKLKRGEEIATIGYGFGDKVPITTLGVYAGNEYFNVEAIAGESGGAVVDAQGRLLILVRRVRVDGFGSPNALLYGAKQGEISDFLWRILGKK